jgi:hypothetical protein
MMRPVHRGRWNGKGGAERKVMPAIGGRTAIARPKEVSAQFRIRLV